MEQEDRRLKSTPAPSSHTHLAETQPMPHGPKFLEEKGNIPQILQGETWCCYSRRFSWPL